ncbi:S1C family serine protease [Maribellus sediminis]|uniref:S1C family serine protease n=1 Tax=Maribellus sediminis TaxID=2696285 RepID=UPI00142F629E|nr:trypsin-like peptidase domain-containing protein [Maribellus sediminis]
MKRILYALALLVLSVQVKSQSFADLVESVKPSVVKIHVLEKKNPGIGNPTTQTSAQGFGSGVLVGKRNNYILTAAHVVANASKIQVEFSDGSMLSAVNRRLDKTADVALIELERPASNFPAAKIGDSDKVRVGEDIFIIGNPLGLSFSVSKGIISGKHSEMHETIEGKIQEFFQTDASINKGNSGGPMFNMQGEVIGIVSSILSFSGGFEGLGFAATSNIAVEILGQQGRIWFGTEILPMNPEFCKIFNVPQEGALMVLNVVDNSPAYFMGLKGGYLTMKIGELEFLSGGDIILQFDDIPLNSIENIEKFYEYMNNLEKGQEYQVKILRNGETKTLRWRMTQ